MYPFNKSVNMGLSTATPHSNSSFIAKIKQYLFSYPGAIVVLGLLIITAFWIFILAQTRFDYDRSIEESSRETMNLSIAFEEHVRGIISDANHDLVSIRDAFERDGSESPLFETLVWKSQGEKARTLIAIYDEKGRIAKSLFLKSITPDISDRDYFITSREASDDRLRIGRPVAGGVSAKNVIPLSRRITKPDGSFGGLVRIGLDANYFLEFYDKINIGEHQLITITGTDGYNRARKVGGEVSFGEDTRDSEYWRNIDEGQTEATVVMKSRFDGIDRITSYRVMPDYPLVLAVGKSLDVALAGYQQRKQSRFAGGVIISLLILVFCGLLIKKYYGTAALSAAAQHERDRLTSLVNSISDEVWFVDPDKRVRFVNDCVAKKIAIKSGDDVAKILVGFEILRSDGTPRPIEETPGIRGLNGEVIRNEQEIVRSPLTGKLSYREVSSNPVCDNNTGEVIGTVSIVRDISERKALEDELKRHRDNLQTLVNEQVTELYSMNNEMRAILAGISDPLYVLDKEWRLKYLNKAAAQSRHFLLKEADIGQIIWDVLPELVGTKFHAVCEKTLAANKAASLVVKSQEGDRLFDGRLFPFSEGLLLYFRDITEQKKYEEEISRLDRLNLIGEMAAGIGHEVRNPLTTVRGYLQLFGRKPDFDKYKDQLTLMIEELDRANSIITEYLSLAKNKAVKLQASNLNMVITSFFPLLQADAYRRGSFIALELEDIPEVYADAKEIRQCLINLVQNGLEAMAAGGKIIVATKYENKKVIMTVRDNGPGIQQDILEKLGTPFCTTKENGTGLGLPVCYRIAQRHEANITVESSSQGTAFHFVFNKIVDPKA